MATKSSTFKLCGLLMVTSEAMFVYLATSYTLLWFTVLARITCLRRIFSSLQIFTKWKGHISTSHDISWPASMLDRFCYYLLISISSRQYIFKLSTNQQIVAVIALPTRRNWKLQSTTILYGQRSLMAPVRA